MEAFMATIMGWAPNFTPRGWAFCWGQIVSIAQNTALFSLLGTTYGGNGQTTFALPNLASRVPIGAGRGPGLSTYELGQLGGSESIVLTVNNMPMHNHDGSQLTAVQNVATSTGSTTQTAATATSILGAPNFSDPGSGSTVDVNTFADGSATPIVPLKLPISGVTGYAGGSQPFPTLPPFLAINWIIALDGIYPPRD